MRLGIKRADASREFLTPERCWILEIANDPADEAVSVARARVPPGVTTEWHEVRSTEERYLILSGRGRVDVGDRLSARVEAGDVVRIPADTPQRIANVGSDDLVFLCICTPRFRAERYVTRPDLEERE